MKLISNDLIYRFAEIKNEVWNLVFSKYEKDFLKQDVNSYNASGSYLSKEHNMYWEHIQSRINQNLVVQSMVVFYVVYGLDIRPYSKVA